MQLRKWILALAIFFACSGLATVAALVVGYVGNSQLSNSGQFASGVAAAPALLVASVAILIGQFNLSARSDAARAAWHSLRRLDEALQQYGLKVRAAMTLRNGEYRSTDGTHFLTSAARILRDAIVDLRRTGAIRWFYDKESDVPDASCAQLLLLLEAHLDDDINRHESAIKDNPLSWGATLLRKIKEATERDLLDIWNVDMAEGFSMFEDWLRWKQEANASSDTSSSNPS